MAPQISQIDLYFIITHKNLKFNPDPMISARLFHARESELPNILRLCEDITNFALHIFYCPHRILRNLRRPSTLFRRLFNHLPVHSEYFIECSRLIRQQYSEYSTQTIHALQHVCKTFENMHTHIQSHLRSFRCTVPRLRILFLYEARLLRISGIIHTRHAAHYRIFKDLRTFPISLPQHFRHIGAHLRIFLLHETLHRHILRHSFTSINPVSLFTPFKSLALISNQLPSIAVLCLHTPNQLVPTYPSSIPFYFFTPFAFLSFLLLFFVFHVSDLCLFISIFHISFF